VSTMRHTSIIRNRVRACHEPRKSARATFLKDNLGQKLELLSTKIIRHNLKRAVKRFPEPPAKNVASAKNIGEITDST
jgi:hypothetical protein